jgi:uncharacterized protein DUF2478
MGTHGIIADAGGEIAAVVYASGDRPDLVLHDFARRLVEGGKRVCGLIQFRERASGQPHRHVLILDGWQMAEVGPAADTEDSRCSLDGHWLDRMGRHAEASIRRGVDLVIVNRFGPLELAGRGFGGAIAAASETETPLVVAVPLFEFEDWTRFSNGMTIRLDCTLAALEDWWRRVDSHAATAGASDLRACELLK